MKKFFENRVDFVLKRVDAQRADLVQYSTDGAKIKMYFSAGFLIVANILDYTGRLCCYSPYCTGGPVIFDNLPSVLEHVKKEIARTRVCRDSKAYESGAEDLQSYCATLIEEYERIGAALANSSAITLDKYEPNPAPAKIRTLAFAPADHEDAVQLVSDTLQRIDATTDDVEHIRVGKDVVIALKSRHVITRTIDSNMIVLRSPCLYCPEFIGIIDADVQELNPADELRLIKHALKIERYIRRYGENHALYMHARVEKDRLEKAVQYAKSLIEGIHRGYEVE